MSWYSPTTIEELTQSVRAGHTFNETTRGLRGHYVAVLSAPLDLDRDHPLSDHVATGAEHYRDQYMSGGGRTPHPSVCVYYVRAGRRAILAVQADGTVLDELDTEGAYLSDRVRTALRSAAAELAQHYAGKSDWV